MRGHFEQIDRTRHLVRTTAKSIMSGETAELNIGIMCTIGPRVLSPMLEAFQMQHPMVSVVLHDVTPSSIPEMLLSTHQATLTVAETRARLDSPYAKACNFQCDKCHVHFADMPT